MARKKKQIRRKKVEEPKERSAFLPLLGATTMCIVALFVLLGGFGTGGALPKNLFHAAYWLLGIGAFLVPVALVYWAMHKFQSEEHRIPKAEFISMLAVLVLTASWLETAFATKSAAGTWTGGHGGALGRGVGSAVLIVLDKMPAALVLFVLSVLALAFAFGVTLSSLLGLFRREDREDETDLAKLKAQQPNNFQLNEGVPVEHHAGPAKLPSLKNTAQKLGANAEHSALTLA